MLLIKGVLGTFLCAAFLAATGGSIFFQQATPGNPDDVAELLPKDTMFFAELSRGPQVLKDWKEYVGAFCTQEGKSEVCQAIEKAVGGGLDAVPEKLRKDLEKGLPSLQRLAVGLLPSENEEGAPGWLVIATSSDPEFFKRIVDEDLKVFAFEERAHQGAKVQAIRKMGEMRFDDPLLVTALENRLIMTTQWDVLTGALDRAAGRRSTEDLRANRLYKAFSSPRGEAPILRAFASFSLDMMEGFGGSRRSMAFSMDQTDAVLDLRKIRGTMLEAAFEPGRVACRTRVHVDPPCRLLDVWRQPAGPKETLRYVPADAQLVAHVDVKSAQELWTSIEALIKRAGEIEKQARGEQAQDVLAEMNREMEREIGFCPADLAPVIGQEGLLAFVGDDAFTSGRETEKALLVVIGVSDTEKARALVEKWVQRAPEGSYERSADGDATLYIGKSEGELPCIALHGTACLFTGKKATLEAALQTFKEGPDIRKNLPQGLASASKLFAVKHRALWQLLQQVLRGGIADVSKSLNLDAWSTVLLSEDADGATAESFDSGCGMLAQTGTLMFPVGFFQLRVSYRPGGPPVVRPAATEEPEPAALPPEQLAERVKKHVEELHSDEVSVRTGAIEGLKELGRQSVPLVLEVVKKETDLETRERLMDLLIGWKVYDAFPELIARKVDGFLRELQEALPQGEYSGWGDGLVAWPREHDAGFPWCTEPYYTNPHLLSGLSHRDVLEAPAMLKALCERLADDKLPLETQRALAQVFMLVDVSKAGEALVAAYERATDEEVRLYLHIALGWIGTPKARERLLSGFKDANRWMSRASFLAADRTRDTAVIPKLIDLLRDPDLETRWNASFTLRRLTGGQVFVNIFRSEDGAAAAQQWWEKHKETHKIGD
ncbi:MAG: HEAT repeat domain-containing protein [Planctomycetes bacterium]|nr:HEAT repeat domain-containing protein [Planctomycetota bacterium]